MWIELRDLCHLQPYLKHISVTDQASNTVKTTVCVSDQVKKNIETTTPIYSHVKFTIWIRNKLLRNPSHLGWVLDGCEMEQRKQADRKTNVLGKHARKPKIQPKQSSNCICTLCMLVNMTEIAYGLYIILHSLYTQWKEPFEEQERWQRNSFFSNHAKHACKVLSADCNIPRTR